MIIVIMFTIIYICYVAMFLFPWCAEVPASFQSCVVRWYIISSHFVLVWPQDLFYWSTRVLYITSVCMLSLYYTILVSVPNIFPCHIYVFLVTKVSMVTKWDMHSLCIIDLSHGLAITIVNWEYYCMCVNLVNVLMYQVIRHVLLNVL